MCKLTDKLGRTAKTLCYNTLIHLFSVLHLPWLLFGSKSVKMVLVDGLKPKNIHDF